MMTNTTTQVLLINQPTAYSIIVERCVGDIHFKDNRELPLTVLKRAINFISFTVGVLCCVLGPP